jgi:hypothetical protein
MRLEGLTPTDAADEDDRYLGCDLSEYYGGQTLVTASRLVVTQLKYSVKHSRRAWSAARLAAKGSAGASPLRRLADMFTGLVEDSDTLTVVSKVSIALVSNQPAGTNLLTALAAAREALTDEPLGAQAGRVFARLSEHHRRVLSTLRTASGLTSGRFTDFVRVLDLSECDTDSRALQALTLQGEASAFLVGPARPGVIGLVELMRRQMLPETAGDRGLCRADIIVALGASGERSLFPYPSYVSKPARLVPTAQPKILASALTAVPAGRLLAHGGPGIGKTTVLMGLEEALPHGSVVVIYDCYANGQYLNPANDRHSERAVVQIANEMAVRGGALPVVVPEGPVVHSELWQGLETTVTAVADNLPQDAVLVIAVDAADNAIYAADRMGAPAFVQGLWHVALPDNARVLMTARSARRSDVLAGTERPGITQIDLGAFDAPESATMLRSVFPEAADEQCAAFHDASKGVARVEAYALGAGEQPQVTGAAPAERGPSIEDAIERAGAGLAAIFDEVLDGAFSTVHDRAVRQQHMAALAAMARPARPLTLARLLDVSEDQVRQLCADLFPALRITEDVIGFADEDFEHHLRRKLSEEEVRRAHDLFAQYFLRHRNVDEEAARLVGEHLFNAGRCGELLELALDEGAPEAIADGMARAHARRARLMLALRAVAGRGEDDRSGDSVRLLLAAGDAARTDSSLVDTVRQRPELAVLHADAAAVAGILLRGESGTWRGRVHLRAAALLAWADGRTPEAAEQLDLALAWLRAWSRAANRYQWDLGPEDIAYGVHAAYVLNGLGQAHRLAAGWRPSKFVDEVTGQLARHAPGHVPVTHVVRDLARVRASAWVQAQFAVAYASSGHRLPARWVQGIAARLDRMPLRPVTYPAKWGVAFCDVALAQGAAQSRVRRLLRRFAPPIPAYVNEYTTSGEMLVPLRAACLDAALRGGAVTPEGLLPDRLRAPAGGQAPGYDENASERQLFLGVAGRLLPVIAAQAECAVAAVSRRPGGHTVETAVAAAVEVVRSTLGGFGDEGAHRFYRPGDRHRSWFVAAVEALTSAAQAVAAVGNAGGREASGTAALSQSRALIEGALAGVGDSIGQLMGDGAAYAWVRMSRALLRSGVAQALALQLLQRAGDAMETANLPAAERRDVLLDAAAAAQDADTDLAKDLFAAAVRAASGVDADIGLRLRALLTIADGIPAVAADGLPAEERGRIALLLAHALEDAAPFVPEPQAQLPYQFALGVATHLHGPTGLALACRWADDGHVGLSEGIETVAPVLAESGNVDAVDAFLMLRLLDQNTDPVSPAAAVLDVMLGQEPARRSQAVACLDTLANWVIRDLVPRRQADAAQRLVTAARQWGLGQIECVQRLQSRSQALTGLFQRERDWRTSRNWHTPLEERQVDAAALIAGASFASIEQDLPALADAYISDEQVVAYLTAAARRAGPGGRADALETLLGLADRRVPGAAATRVAAAVRELREEWRASTSVRSWARRRLPEWVARHLLDLFTTGPYRHGTYTTMLQMPSSDPRRSQWLLSASASHLDELTATQLYTLATTLAETLPTPPALAGIVTWAVTSTPSLPHPASSVDHPMAASTPGPRIEMKALREALPSPPAEPAALLAAALWSLLGHPDRRVRWRAAHTVRLMLTRGTDGRAIAAELWLCAFGGTGSDRSRGFRSATLEFFPLSARQWLLIAFARVAGDMPAALTPLAPELAAAAADREHPHAAIRELARQAALDIAAAEPGVLPATVLDSLAFANRPDSCSTSSGTPDVGSRYDDYGTRFRFDPMDVVPYWYTPLAEAFDGVGLADVMRRADTWISDRWGRSSDETWRDPRVHQHEHSWGLISADHGSLPIVETLQKYLEYHALQMVAGELLDEGMPVRRHWADESDSWDAWLVGHLPRSPTHWVADAREPVPARPLTLGNWSQLQAIDAIEQGRGPASGSASASAARPEATPKSTFNGATVAQQACRALEQLEDDPDVVVVAASITTRADGHACTVWSTSALVTPDASNALLAALATSPLPPTLPKEDDTWEGELDEPDLKLLGWLTDTESAREGLDRDDPLTGGISGHGRIPCADFLAWARLSSDAACSQFIDRERRLGAHMTCWGDVNKRGQGSEDEDYTGSYLTVRRDLLIAYLDRRHLSLVSAVDAHVYAMGRSSHPEDKDVYQRSRYVTLGADGRTNSVEVGRALGERASRRGT